MSINKKSFIYETNKSLTNELCDEIIKIFDGNNVNNKYFINTTINFKIHNALIKEIKNNLKLYKINLFKIFESDSKNNCINNFEINIESEINENTIFAVEKKIYSEYDKTDFELNQKYKLNKNTILKYIWFLNDYCGEFVFSEDIIIKPVKGKLIIFPVSWCFSFIENIQLFDTKYCICGEIMI